MTIPKGLWLKLFRKFAKIFAAQGAPPASLTPVANKKSLIRKVFIILFEHLWVVELTYGQFFSFQFPLRCKQSNIVPIICHHVTDIGGKLPPVLLTPVTNLP
jgi:hypothetical protein